ncbi:putative reverse transcriptase domain-containing protein [Tanacetum coccineum]
MPPMMTTQSVGRAGRGGGRTRGRSCDQGNGRIDGKGGQVGGQGSEVNDGVKEVPKFSTIIAQQLQNLLPTIVAQIEKMESVQDMSECKDSQKVKYTTSSFVNKAHMVELSNPHTRSGSRCRFQELARLVPHLVTPKGKRIERNGSIKKNYEKRGNGGEPSKDRNGREDNKRTRTGNAFATTTNPVRGENMGAVPKCPTCNTHHPPEAPCHACFNCNRPGHFAKDCRVVPRNVNPINARNLIVRACYECGSTDHIKSACPRLNQAQRPGGNHQNQVVAVNRGQGCGNQGNQARGRAFMLGAEEARQD